MIRLLITKDGATIVPKDVETLEDAKGYADAGFHVDVEAEDGRHTLAAVQEAADAGFGSVTEHRAALAEAAAALEAEALATKKADAEKAVADAKVALEAADTDEAKAQAQAVLEAAEAALVELG